MGRLHEAIHAPITDPHICSVPGWLQSQCDHRLGRCHTNTYTATEANTTTATTTTTTTTDIRNGSTIHTAIISSASTCADTNAYAVIISARPCQFVLQERPNAATHAHITDPDICSAPGWL